MNHPQTRRECLCNIGKLGVLGISASLFPAWMPRLAFSAPGQSTNGDVLVSIFLRGGLDGLAAVAPYTDGAYYYDPRPTTAVPAPGSTNGGINLDGQFALHPSLGPFKTLYDAGQLAIVHACGSIDPSRSHFDAMQFMEYGIPGNKTVGVGWIGRHLASAPWQNDSPLRAVGIGSLLQTSLRGPVSALALESIASFHLRGRGDQLEKIRQTLSALYEVNAPVDPLGSEAKLLFDTIDTLQTLSDTEYQPANGATYPDTDLGRGLRQIAQLIKADLGLETACVDTGGFDTHETQGTIGGDFANLMSRLAQALAAFHTDLGAMMGNVCVVVMSEFGRRVGENGSRGTDHGHGNVMFVLGGGVNGGQVFTDWPTLAPNAQDDGDLAITIDYRDVLAEIVQHRLLNPNVAQVFPGYTPGALGIVQPKA